MAMSVASVGLIHTTPGFWGFALAALALILSPAAAVWISFHRRRVLLARVEKDRFQVQCEREARRRELNNQHTERMLELKTARQLGLLKQKRLMLIATRDQARLDRALDAELDLQVQLSLRVKTEPDAQLAAVSVPPPKPAAAQVEKKAA